MSFGSSLSSVTVVSSGLSPDANTVLLTPPASTSSCVIMYVAKYVAVSPTNKIPSTLPKSALSNVGPVVNVKTVPSKSVKVSVMVTPSKVTSPVFSTVIV